MPALAIVSYAALAAVLTTTILFWSAIALSCSNSIYLYYIYYRYILYANLCNNLRLRNKEPLIYVLHDMYTVERVCVAGYRSMSIVHIFLFAAMASRLLLLRRPKVGDEFKMAIIYYIFAIVKLM